MSYGYRERRWQGERGKGVGEAKVTLQLTQSSITGVTGSVGLEVGNCSLQPVHWPATVCRVQDLNPRIKTKTMILTIPLPAATVLTLSNHVSSDSREKTQLSSKSASHLDRRPVSRDGGSHTTGSKSATNVIPHSTAAGAPVSEHREKGRKEKYNISKTRAEELRFEGKSSSQSEKLQRQRNRVRAESAASGVRTQPHTPDLGTRGRARSDVLQGQRHESLV